MNPTKIVIKVREIRKHYISLYDFGDKHHRNRNLINIRHAFSPIERGSIAFILSVISRNIFKTINI